MTSSCTLSLCHGLVAELTSSPTSSQNNQREDSLSSCPNRVSRAHAHTGLGEQYPMGHSTLHERLRAGQLLRRSCCRRGLLPESHTKPQKKQRGNIKDVLSDQLTNVIDHRCHVLATATSPTPQCQPASSSISYAAVASHTL